MRFDTFFRVPHEIITMQVRDWREIVRDVVETDADPNDWRAIAGPREGGLGEDLYLSHPRSGVFLLKTYTKNPFERKGVGSRVARSIDDEIGAYMPERGGDRFAVHSQPATRCEAEARAERVQEALQKYAARPAGSDELFEDFMRAIESPAFGPLTFDPRNRPGSLDGLAGTFDEAEDVLDAEVDALIDEDELDRGFG